MSQNKPVTIKEIARRLKISTSTVSRALNDHPSIGWATTTRVKRMAEELNYVPNQTAIFFKQRKTFTIGVILPSLSEPFFSSAISEIENYASEQKYTVIMGQSLDDPERETRIIEKMREHRVDGILMSLSKNREDFGFIESLRTAGIPIVFFDCVPDIEDAYRVRCNLETGMLQAIDLFISCGHSQIALVNGPALLPASVERKETYEKGLAENGLPYMAEYLVDTDLTPQGNEEAIAKLLNLPRRPSAIICFNDFVTLDVMKYVRQRGLSLNQDLFFISFANYPLWQYIENPPMASIEQFPGKQAHKATEMLFQLIDSAEAEIPRHVVFESSMIPKSV